MADIDWSLYAKGLPSSQPSGGRGLIVPAIESGFEQAAGQLSSGVRAIGDLTGFQALTNAGAQGEQVSNAKAAADANPAYEGSPFQGGVGHAIPWSIYNVLKGLPQLAAIGGAAALAPEAEVPLLGARAASLAGAAAATPFALGEGYQATEQTPGGPGNAEKAALMTPALAVLQSWLPTHAEGLIERAAGTGIGGMLKAGLVTGAVQAPVAGVMTAITDAANPNLTPKQRISNVVDAAVGGGLMGGVIGTGAAGIGGLRAMKHVDPSNVPTGDIASAVDQTLQLTGPAQPGGPQVGSGPTMFADAGGRVAPNNADLTATPRDTGMSPTDRMVAEATIPQPQPAIDSSTIIQDKQGSLRHAQPYEQDDTSRPFRNSTDAELQSAHNALLAKGDDISDDHAKLLDLVKQELQQRNPALTADQVQGGVGAVERARDVKSGAADQNSAAPAPTNTWEDARDDLLKGIGTRKSYTDASTIDEMKATLLERLKNGSSAKGDLLLADRLGVDVNAPDTAAAPARARAQGQTGDTAAVATDTKTSTPEPAAPANEKGGDQPVDADFQKQWAQDLSDRRGLLLKDLRDNPPAGLQDAQQRLYDALGRNVKGEDEAQLKGRSGAQAVVDLAKKYGVLDDNERYTDAAADISRKSITMDAAVQAAQDHGLSGAEASAFDKGARAQPATLGSIDELKAYQAGKDWSRPDNAASDDTQKFIDDKLASKDNGNTVTSAKIPDEVHDKRWLNLAVDQVYGSTTTPTEQAQLKRMVQDGATSKQIDDAARYFGSGHGALTQEQPARKSYTGEVVTPGRITSLRAQARAEAAREQTAEGQQSKQQRLQNSQALIEAHQQQKALLRQEIEAAHQSSDITGVDRLRLLNHLSQNDFQGVTDRLPGGKLNRQDTSIAPQLDTFAAAVSSHDRAGLLAGHEVSPEVMKQLGARNISGALGHIAQHGSTAGYRAIAAKLRNGDWHSKINLAIEPPSEVRTGRTELSPKGDITVRLYGNSGLTEETFLHEMYHAATYSKWRDSLENLAKTGNADPVVVRTQQLWQQVKSAIAKANPELLSDGSWGEHMTANPDEMIAWGLTNRDAQQYLSSIDVDGNRLGKSDNLQPQSVWGRIVDWARNMLGLQDTKPVMSALDHILDAGHSIVDAEGVDKNLPPQTAPVINDRLQATVKQVADDGAEKAKELLKHAAGDARGKTFRALLDTRSAPDLAEMYGRREKVLPELMPWQAIRLRTDAIPTLYTRVQRVAFDEFTKLENADPKAAERVNNVMAAPARGVNGELAWKDHTWLHKDPQAGILKSYVDGIHRDAEALRAAGQLGVYHGLRDSLRAVDLSQKFGLLHMILARNSALKHVALKLGDPTSDFMTKTEQHTPAAATKFWSDTLNSAMSTIEKEFATVRGDPALSAADRDRFEKHMSPTETVIEQIKSNIAISDRVPYFHLYREGDHMVAAKLRSLDDGRADPVSAKAVAAELGKLGFTDMSVAPELANPRVFLTVDNKSQRDLLAGALNRLAKQGHIEDGSVLSGRRGRESALAPASKAALDDILRQVAADPLFDINDKAPDEAKVVEDQLAAVQNALREAWLNSLPANSFSRVMAHRDTVQGFSKDMVKSTNFRFGVGAQALGRIWSRPRIDSVVTAMEARLRDAMHVDDPQHKNVDTIQALINNVRQRDIASAMTSRHDWTDTVRTVSNVFHIGASPAMILVDGSQIGVLVFPHLGARHGFANAFAALAKSTPTALRVMREALTQGWAISAARAADASITHDVLMKAVPDVAKRNFLEHMIARGAIDMSSLTYAMTSDADLGASPKMTRLLRYAAALPQYTELASRVITVLAARELHGGKMAMPVEDYAAQTVNDTLGHYGHSSVPPIMTKQGPLKQLGPMLLQFKLFDLNLMWKLYREFHTAFVSKAANETERGEARRFLLGHAVAVTALAGTLGLPFAGAAAGAVDKLKDELMPSDHPFNAVAAYRNFLADMFGKDVANVLAKGLPPTAAGFDLSTRVGEGDILPLTQFLTSRRTWSDTMQQWQADAIGAPASMITDQWRGLDQIHNGNVLGGMSTMLPSAIRNPLRAYQMTERGYVDSNGMPLPLDTPGAGAILSQLLGLVPAEKAAYNDDQEVRLSTKAALTRESNALKDNLLRAVQSGDMDTARDMLGKTQQFDEANPAYAVMPRFEELLRQREVAQGESQETQTPLGVKATDAYTRGLLRYSNVDYHAQ